MDQEPISSNRDIEPIKGKRTIIDSAKHARTLLDSLIQPDTQSLALVIVNRDGAMVTYDPGNGLAPHTLLGVISTLSFELSLKIKEGLSTHEIA